MVDDKNESFSRAVDLAKPRNRRTPRSLRRFKRDLNTVNTEYDKV